MPTLKALKAHKAHTFPRRCVSSSTVWAKVSEGVDANP